MILKGANNEQYVTGRELGRGGEGTVYELQNNSSLVLKKYNEPLTPTQVAKLAYMVSIRSATIEAYAAWPTGLAMDDAGTVCGFVMKKLIGYVPLHMIFSPMDRKRMFPDKGYNFLVHVARNLATAFHNLHEAGLVVGDVNEGNILISAGGLVSFIDCDSFQIKERDSYYYCEVGVPRYTPPELLSERTFEHVVRTVNTDSFSLGVLLFQLLFLGRHPFAGKNKTAKDIDEETAIRQHEFAYSLENKRKKLHPPNDSFAITNLPDGLVALFHQAFEQLQRPVPALWVKALDNLLGEMTTCDESRLHTYPAQMQECPWCYFKNTRGILYFLDDTYLHANTVFDDIDSFVNGFHVDKLELKKWSGPQVFPDVLAQPIPEGFKRNRSRRRALAIVCVICFGSLFLFKKSGAMVSFDIVLWVVFSVITVLGAAIARLTRSMNIEKSKMRAEYVRLVTTRDSMIAEYNSPRELPVYYKGIASLEKMVKDYRDLPNEYNRRKKLAEEQVFDEQLQYYLRLFAIQDHTIPSFGAAKKAALYNSGIYNAADITRLSTMKIPGIGPKNQQVLLSWQRQMTSGFVYIPDDSRIAAELKKVDHEMEQIKQGIGSAMRKEYQSLSYMKLNITNRLTVMAHQINDISKKARQAELDMLAFKRYAL